jgi:hypothetical protein
MVSAAEIAGASHSTSTSGARNADFTLVAGRPGQSHHSVDDSIANEKGSAGLTAGGAFLFDLRRLLADGARG